jgi:hypothetical protein
MDEQLAIAKLRLTAAEAEKIAASQLVRAVLEEANAAKTEAAAALKAEAQSRGRYMGCGAACSSRPSQEAAAVTHRAVAAQQKLSSAKDREATAQQAERDAEREVDRLHEEVSRSAGAHTAAEFGAQMSPGMAASMLFGNGSANQVSAASEVGTVAEEAAALAAAKRSLAALRRRETLGLSPDATDADCYAV